jgi:hypothetical protein
MNWVRIRYVPAVKIRGYLRHYIDGVRSDGFQFRAGLDGQATEEDLRSALDAFLPKTMKVPRPGPDAHKGDEGWVECA